ncbi:MAG: GNAT family N-acetyltransferase [Actinomycetota bacterium]
MTVSVGLARLDEVDEIARVLARAFFHDPVMTWVMPCDGTRLRQLARLYRSIVRFGGIQAGVTTVARDDGVRGAGVWRRRVSPAGFAVRDIPFALGSGRALGRDMGRMIEMGRAVDAAHPKQPHWYLQLLGVDPAAQHGGIGAALMSAQLDTVDAERLPAYLETTAENLEFYARFGFVVTGEIPFSGRPSEYALWRATR